MDDQTQRIKKQYGTVQGDSTDLFREILRAADEIGLEQALSILEECVIEKRKAWAVQNLGRFTGSGDPVWDGYRLFYEAYLGLSTPQDGEIVARGKHQVISRWWNPCPTLDACVELGLDTREICRKVYHRPVQEVLTQLHPDLRFDRNYACIRPHAPFCEEIIYLDDETEPTQREI